MEIGPGVNFWTPIFSLESEDVVSWWLLLFNDPKIEAKCSSWSCASGRESEVFAERIGFDTQ